MDFDEIFWRGGARLTTNRFDFGGNPEIMDPGIF